MFQTTYTETTLSLLTSFPKGHTRTVSHKLPVLLPNEVLDAHRDIIAKRKLNPILRSKAVKYKIIKVGDLLQVFQKDKEKRGKWSLPTHVLAYDPSVPIVTVLGAQGRIINAATEDVKMSVLED